MIQKALFFLSFLVLGIGCSGKMDPSAARESTLQSPPAIVPLSTVDEAPANPDTSPAAQIDLDTDGGSLALPPFSSEVVPVVPPASSVVPPAPSVVPPAPSVVPPAPSVVPPTPSVVPIAPPAVPVSNRVTFVLPTSFETDNPGVWSEGAALEAILDYYLATKDTGYLDDFKTHVEYVLSKEQRYQNKIDFFRGRAMPGWGVATYTCAKYTYTPNIDPTKDGTYSCELGDQRLHYHIIHASYMGYPMALFVKILQEHWAEPAFQKYHLDAEKYVRFLSYLTTFFLPTDWSKPGLNGEWDGTKYRFSPLLNRIGCQSSSGNLAQAYCASHSYGRLAGQPLPLNMQAGLGRLLAILSVIDPQPFLHAGETSLPYFRPADYRTGTAKILKYLTSRLEPDQGKYAWNYMQVDSAIVVPAEFAPLKERREDMPHSNILVSFIATLSALEASALKNGGSSYMQSVLPDIGLPANMSPWLPANNSIAYLSHSLVQTFLTKIALHDEEGSPRYPYYIDGIGNRSEPDDPTLKSLLGNNSSCRNWLDLAPFTAVSGLNLYDVAKEMEPWLIEARKTLSPELVSGFDPHLHLHPLIESKLLRYQPKNAPGSTDRKILFEGF